VLWLWSFESTYPGKYAFLTAACPLLDVGDPVNFAAALSLRPLVCTGEPYGPANQICTPQSYPNQTTLYNHIGNLTFKPFLKGLARLSPTGPGPGPHIIICFGPPANLPLLARHRGTKAVYIIGKKKRNPCHVLPFWSPHPLARGSQKIGFVPTAVWTAHPDCKRFPNYLLCNRTRTRSANASSLLPHTVPSKQRQRYIGSFVQKRIQSKGLQPRIGTRNNCVDSTIRDKKQLSPCPTLAVRQQVILCLV
jgi:hypothetical protein